MAKILELHMKKAGITDLKIKRDDGRIMKKKLIKTYDLKNLTKVPQAVYFQCFLSFSFKLCLFFPRS